MDFSVRISPFPRLELMCTTLFLLCWFDYRAVAEHATAETLLRKTRQRHLTCDGFGAGLTLLSIQVAKTLEAVRAVVSGGEMLTCELCLTAGAHKTLLMPRLIPIGHATFRQGLKTQGII